MRQISPDALAILAEKLGNEPIAIVEIDWTGNGKPISYTDRDLADGTKGRIITISDLDNIVDVSASNNSQQLSVTLDDHDGTIKAILDSTDVHQRPVNVYQYFDGLALSDKFLLFSGRVSSPIVWSEGNRTVSFTVISQLEDREIGFSAEAGEFPFIPSEMVGKAWPIIFGTVFDVPALQVNHAVSGTTLDGVGIVSGADLHDQVPLGGTDCGLGMSLAMMAEQASLASLAASAWADVDAAHSAALLDQVNSVFAQMAQAASGNEAQTDCAKANRKAQIDDAKANAQGPNPLRILGGEDFPQNKPITLNINGGLFTGIMRDDDFTISTRKHPENEAKAQDSFDSVEQCSQPTPPQFFDISEEVPPGRGDNGGDTIRRSGFILCNIPQASRPSVDQVAEHFWAEAGARVVMASDEPITYIVSITPGTVLAVKAFKQFTGERRLVNVPHDLWTAQSKTYGSISAVQVVVNKPLSTIVDQGWEDDLYVTFDSTIGPNVVDILKYIIDRWTDLNWDATTFNSVAAKVENFPANFPILDRRNTIEVLQEIAFQARCALWLSNGVFYLKFLPDEPAADATITASDIATSDEGGGSSIEVQLTPTEDLVTKMTVTWRRSWATDEPQKFIIRRNVEKYGTKAADFDFYIYNNADVAFHCASFWSIRKSNTWKRVRFQTKLNLLNLETFDTVLLSFGHVASGSVKAIVENASYNSEDNTINFECWLPVLAGTMTQYQFAWPAAVTAELNDPNAGSNTGAAGNLPVGDTSGITLGGTVFVGGPNVVFRGRSDRGTRRPGDVGFTPQQAQSIETFGEIRVSGIPPARLRLMFLDPQRPPVVQTTRARRLVIDVNKTMVIDSRNPNKNQHASFSDTFMVSAAGGLLAIRTNQAWFTEDGTDLRKFDFQFDTVTQQWGAGTAFLQE